MWSIISSEFGLKFVVEESRSRRGARSDPAAGSAAARPVSSSARAMFDRIVEPQQLAFDDEDEDLYTLQRARRNSVTGRREDSIQAKRQTALLYVWAK
jgi:hypothetical protein